MSGRLGRALRWLAAGMLMLPYRDDDRMPARLVDCGACRARLVNPVEWHERDRSHWWIRLRCGACGWSREVVVGDEDANQLERDLEPGLRVIAAAVERLDRERMRREVDAFAAALERELIGPDDFSARPGEARRRT